MLLTVSLSRSTFVQSVPEHFSTVHQTFVYHILSHLLACYSSLRTAQQDRAGWAAVRRRPIAVLLRQQQVCITHRPVVEVFISSESYLRAISSFLAPMQQTLTRWAKTDPFLTFQQIDSFGWIQYCYDPEELSTSFVR